MCVIISGMGKLHNLCTMCVCVGGEGGGAMEATHASLGVVYGF